MWQEADVRDDVIRERFSKVLDLWRVGKYAVVAAELGELLDYVGTLSSLTKEEVAHARAPSPFTSTRCV